MFNVPRGRESFLRCHEPMASRGFYRIRAPVAFATPACRAGRTRPTTQLEETDMRRLLVAALALPLLAIAGSGDQLAMGPDPGGHTGATVTPETTRTDNPAVDAARQSASGSKTESNQGKDKK
jgi:hypothetical protein